MFLERRGDQIVADDQPSVRRDPEAPMVLRGSVHIESGALAIGAGVVRECRGGSALISPLPDDDTAVKNELAAWGLALQSTDAEVHLQICDEPTFWLRFIPRATYAGLQPWDLMPNEFAGAPRFHALSRAIGEPKGREIDRRYLEEYNAYRHLRERAYGVAIEEYRRCFPEFATSVRVALEATPGTARYLYQAALRSGELVDVAALEAFPDLLLYARAGRRYERTSPGLNSPERHRFREIVDECVTQLSQTSAEVGQYEERLARCKSQFSPYGKTYRSRLDILRAREENLRNRRRFAVSVLERAERDDATYEAPSIKQLELLS